MYKVIIMVVITMLLSCSEGSGPSTSVVKAGNFLRGTVITDSGNALVGAQVVLLKEETVLSKSMRTEVSYSEGEELVRIIDTTITDNDGFYQFENISHGNYIIKVSFLDSLLVSSSIVYSSEDIQEEAIIVNDIIVKSLLNKKEMSGEDVDDTTDIPSADVSALVVNKTEYQIVQGEVFIPEEHIDYSATDSFGTDDSKTVTFIYDFDTDIIGEYTILLSYEGFKKSVFLEVVADTNSANTALDSIPFFTFEQDGFRITVTQENIVNDTVKLIYGTIFTAPILTTELIIDGGGYTDEAGWELTRKAPSVGVGGTLGKGDWIVMYTVFSTVTTDTTYFNLNVSVKE